MGTPVSGLGVDEPDLGIPPFLMAYIPPTPGGMTSEGRTCPPGEHAIMDTPRPELLDGVMVSFPAQEVCVPDDALEMVMPAGVTPCYMHPIRKVTRQTGEKGPWMCPSSCTKGQSAILTPQLTWKCQPGSEPNERFPGTGYVPHTSTPSNGNGGNGLVNGGGEDFANGNGAAAASGFPWLWLLGGVAVLGVGGYLGYRYLY